MAIENKQLTTQLHETVTGGDSYPYFLYGLDVRHINDPSVLAVSLSVQGEKPIFDVTIEHVDISDLPIKPEQYTSPQDLINATLAMNLGPVKGGTFLPNRSFTVALIRMKPEWEERKLRLTTIARNGAFTQLTTLKKDPDSGYWCMVRAKVTKEKLRGEPEKILKDEDFTVQAATRLSE